MGEKDQAEKQLEAYNDVFADIVNAIVFQGNQCVKPEDLQELDTNSAYMGDGALRGQVRDVVKLWKDGLIGIALFGIENQTSPDPDMPVRVMGYDYASYRHEVEHGEGRHPVLTLVLYMGYKTRWNRPKSLKEWFDPNALSGLNPEDRSRLEKYISDYPIHVVEVAWLSKEQLSHFRSEFRIVAEWFCQLRKYGDYLPDQPTVVNHAHALLNLMRALTGDRRFVEIKCALDAEGGPITVDTIIDQFIKKGKQEGLEEGRKEGREENRVETIVEIMKKNHFTYDHTVELMNLSESDKERYRSAVEKALES
jgi:hypothetical protein